MMQNDPYDSVFPGVINPEQAQYDTFGSFPEAPSLPQIDSQRTFQNASTNPVMHHQRRQQQASFTASNPAIMNVGSHGLMGPPSSSSPLSRFFRDPYPSWSPVRPSSSSAMPAISTPENQQRTNMTSPIGANGSVTALGPPRASSDSGYTSIKKLHSLPNAGFINTNVRQRGGSFSGNNSASWQSPSGHLQPPTASPTSPEDFATRPRNSKRKLREDDPEASIICKYTGCEVISRTQSAYRKHALQHDRPYKCHFEKCPKHTEGFPTKNDRSRHEASVHHIFEGGMKTFVCRMPDCSQRHKLWPRQDNFDNHVQKLHNMEKGVGNNDKRRQEFIKKSTVTVPREGWDLSRVIKNLNIGCLLSGKNPYPIRNPDYDQPVPKIVFDNLDEISNGYEVRSASDAEPSFQNMGFVESVRPYSCQSDISGDELTSQPNQYDPGWMSGSTSLGMDMDVDGSGLDMAFSASPLIPENGFKTSKAMQAQDVSLTGGILEGPRSPPSTVMHLNSNSSGQRPKNSLRDLAQHLATEAEAFKLQDTPTKDFAEEIFEILQARLPKLREYGSVRGRGLSQPVSSKAVLYSNSHDIPQNRSASILSGKQNYLEYECEKCNKGFRSNAKRRKHERRHEQRYGCTFEKCRQFFGSKSDWKRHENSMHFSQDVWLCSLPTVSQFLSNMSHDEIMNLREHPRAQPPNYCGHKAHQRDKFENHLKAYHHISNLKTVDAITNRQHLGMNHQGSFWCGFCCLPVKLEKQRESAWEERFNHIEKHFNTEKKSANDWVPPGSTMTKGELFKQRDQQADISSSEESEDSEDDVKDTVHELLTESSRAQQSNSSAIGNDRNKSRQSSHSKRIMVYCKACGDGPHSSQALDLCPQCGGILVR